MKCGDDGRGGVVAGAGGSMNMFPTLSPAELFAAGHGDRCGAAQGAALTSTVLALTPAKNLSAYVQPCVQNLRN